MHIPNTQIVQGKGEDFVALDGSNSGSESAGEEGDIERNEPEQASYRLKNQTVRLKAVGV